MPHAKGFRRRSGDPSSEPVELGDVIDNLMADQLFARGMPVAQLAAAWSSVVGERLASETAPATLEGGVLTVTAPALTCQTADETGGTSASSATLITT